MRSIYSDPIASGVDAFSKVVGTVDQLQNSKMRRELMAQQEADRRIQNERQARVDSRQDKLWAEEDEKKYGQKNLNNLATVYDAQQKADTAGVPLKLTDLSDDQLSSVLYMADHKGFFDKDGKLIPEKLEGIKTLQSVMQSPELQDAMKQKKQVRLDLLKDKKVGDALSAIYGAEFNKGLDRAGNTASKRPAAALIDFSGKMPTVTFELEVTPPKNGVGNLIPLKGYEKDVYNIPEDPRPAGQIERGNIDLSQRKVSINDNGSISTVLSTSFQIDGKEVLVPRVNDAGKILTPEEALAEYKRTGKHLGVFEDSKSADQYAEALHNSKIWQPSIDYYTQGSYVAPMTFGRNGDPSAPIQQIPAPLLAMQLTSLDKLGGWVNQLEAQYGSTEFSKRIQGLRKNKETNERAVAAYNQSGGNQKKFTKALMDQGMGVDEIKKYTEVFTKTTPKMESQAGKQMADREKLVKEFGETSAEVKKFDEGTSTKGKPKEGEIRHYEDRGKRIYEEFKGGEWKKKSSSPAFKPESDKPQKEDENLKDKRLRAVADLEETPAIVKHAQNKIRKDPKLDAQKAVDDAKGEINTAIREAGNSSKALKSLKAMGVSDEDATDAIRKYIKKTTKKATK